MHGPAATDGDTEACTYRQTQTDVGRKAETDGGRWIKPYKDTVTDDTNSLCKVIFECDFGSGSTCLCDDILFALPLAGASAAAPSNATSVLADPGYNHM